MGNAESSQQVQSQQNRPVQRNTQQQQYQQRRPVQRNTQQQQYQQRRPVQRNTQQQNNLTQIQQQLQYQQQQLESQRRHQKRLEDQLELQNQKQDQNNRLLQEYIESQVKPKSKYQQLTSGEIGNQTYKQEDTSDNTTEVIDSEYNSYEILGLDQGCSFDEIKKAYKKRALQYHPDRGGNKAIFALIKKAYNDLLAEYEQEHQFENKINQEVSNSQYEADLTSGFQNRYVDKDNFNINKFNKVFNEYRIDDDNDDGYGELMNNKDTGNIEMDKTVNRSSNFSVNSFNQNFNQQKKRNHSTKIIEYKEPEALISTDRLGFSELGGGKIDDFSSNSSNMQYTDYKKAHITDTTLIDPNQVNYKQYNSVNDLKRDRENVKYSMSRQEKLDYENRKREEAFKEQQRKQRLRERDGLIQDQFQRINTNMITH